MPQLGSFLDSDRADVERPLLPASGWRLFQLRFSRNTPTLKRHNLVAPTVQDADALISRLAGPLSPPNRAAFRAAAEDALTRVPCWGEGTVYRAVAREVRNGNDTTPRACCPNSAAPGPGRTPGRGCNGVPPPGRVLAAIWCARRDPWALGTRSDEGAVSVVYGGCCPLIGGVPYLVTSARLPAGPPFSI